METTKNDIIFNWMLDLRKKPIDPWHRAMTIQTYIKNKGLSQRKLAYQLGVPHSTMQDWLRWTKITKTEYERMQKNGLTHTDVYRALRDNQSDETKAFTHQTVLDLEIHNAIKTLRKHIREPNTSKATLVLLEELKDVLNRIHMHIDRKENGR